jgi:hypothetical protein
MLVEIKMESWSASILHGSLNPVHGPLGYTLIRKMGHTKLAWQDSGTQ